MVDFVKLPTANQFLFCFVISWLTCMVPSDRQVKPTHWKTTSFYFPTTGAGCELDKKISIVLNLHWQYRFVGICESHDVQAVDKLKPKRYRNSLLAVVEVFDTRVAQLSWNEEEAFVTLSGVQDFVWKELSLRCMTSRANGTTRESERKMTFCFCTVCETMDCN